MFSLLRVLQDLGGSIAFAASFPDSFPPFSDSLAEDTARMRDLGIDMPPPGTTVDDRLARDGAGYDVVLLTGTFVASRHLRSVRRFAPQAALVFDTIDLHFLREYRGARLTGSVPRLQAALRTKRVELAVARAADFTLVVSEREQQVLASQTPPISSWVVPLTCEVHPAPGPEARRDLVYLGAFTFDPNVDAMVFFVERVLPRIARRLPGVTLQVVGSDPTPEVMNLHGSGVNVTGPVPRLADRFDRCRAFVAPLRYGAGVKSKLLLSMAHGLPVVASTIAAEGIPARHGVDLLIANEPDEWEDNVVRVCQDDALWATLSANGQALVRRHHSFETVRRQVAALCDAIRRRLPHEREITA
jgi:glycosyltransferase involved in cell wall biosynthesis